MDLAEFVRAGRIEKSSRKSLDESRSFYIWLFRRAEALARPLGLTAPVTLHLVNTMQRQCELRPGEDGHTLVYDHSFGDSMSILTGLLLRCSSADAVVFYFQFFAEEFYLKHEYLRAVQLLGEHLRLRRGWKNSNSAILDRDAVWCHMQFVTTEQLFIMLHELLHVVAPTNLAETRQVAQELFIRSQCAKIRPEWSQESGLFEQVMADDSFVQELWCDINAMKLVAGDAARRTREFFGEGRLGPAAAMSASILALDCQGLLQAVRDGAAAVAAKRRGAPRTSNLPPSRALEVRAGLLLEAAKGTCESEFGSALTASDDFQFLCLVRWFFSEKFARAFGAFTTRFEEISGEQNIETPNPRQKQERASDEELREWFDRLRETFASL